MARPLLVRPKLQLTANEATAFLRGGLVGVNVQNMADAGPGRLRVLSAIARRIFVYDDEDWQEKWIQYRRAMGEVERSGYAMLDCEDLADMLSGEMIIDRAAPYYDPGASVLVLPLSPNYAHVVTDSPRFGILDPSAWAGMSTPWRPEPPPPEWIAWANAASVEGHMQPPGGRGVLASQPSLLDVVMGGL